MASSSALRLAKLRTVVGCGAANMLGLDCNRIAAAAMSSPLDKASIFSPEFDREPVEDPNTSMIEIGFPSYLYSGSMDLMAVPKKKTSPHKRGIRNGPKALKPTPVIVRCRVCGRVKLPHFFCCSGLKENTGEQNGSTR